VKEKEEKEPKPAIKKKPITKAKVKPKKQLRKKPRVPQPSRVL
jgi:hypothetical protein